MFRCFRVGDALACACAEVRVTLARMPSAIFLARGGSAPKWEIKWKRRLCRRSSYCSKRGGFAALAGITNKIAANVMIDLVLVYGMLVTLYLSPDQKLENLTMFLLLII